MTSHIDHRGVAFRLYGQGDGSLKGLNLNFLSHCGHAIHGGYQYNVLVCVCFVCFCYQISLIILHVEQLNGLSPVYFILCIFKCSNLLNESPHCPQGKGLPLHYGVVEEKNPIK